MDPNLNIKFSSLRSGFVAKDKSKSPLQQKNDAGTRPKHLASMSLKTMRVKDYASKKAEDYASKKAEDYASEKAEDYASKKADDYASRRLEDYALNSRKRAEDGRGAKRDKSEACFEGWISR